MSAAPTTAYWHLWTGEDGISRQESCELSAFDLKGAGNAAPQWNDKQARSEATVVNLEFGGRYRSRLLICAGHKLYAICTNVRGAVRL